MPFDHYEGWRNKEKLDKIVIELEEKGADVIAVKTDVSSEQDCRNLIEKTVSHFKTIDILNYLEDLSKKEEERE